VISQTPALSEAPTDFTARMLMPPLRPRPLTYRAAPAVVGLRRPRASRCHPPILVFGRPGGPCKPRVVLKLASKEMC
jgi:hypothetical protein